MVAFKTVELSVVPLNMGRLNVVITILISSASILFCRSLRISEGREITQYARGAEWYVALYDAGRLRCGGVVVGERHVLTAKHCMKGIVEGMFALYAGGGWHEAESVSVWGEGSDLALVKTYRHIGQRPAEMNLSPSEPEDGYPLLVSGRGVTRSARSSGEVLDARVNVVSNDRCEKMYGPEINDSKMCAWSPPQGPCYGDSGDPLWDPLTGLLYGIVSKGGSGCVASGPSVFERISHYAESIRSLVGVK